MYVQEFTKTQFAGPEYHLKVINLNRPSDASRTGIISAAMITQTHRHSRTGIILASSASSAQDITVREYERPAMKYSSQDIGRIVRETRKTLGVTQKDLALTSGTGLRFVIELEKGKPTCEIGKALTVVQTLGIRIMLTPPTAAKES
jgi:HTH-type transcriptional regulator / antitoxin HipB